MKSTQREVRNLKEENKNTLRIIGLMNVVTILAALVGYNIGWIGEDKTSWITEGIGGVVCGTIGYLASVLGTRKAKHTWLFGRDENTWPFAQSFTDKVLSDTSINTRKLRQKVDPWPVTAGEQTERTMELLREYEWHPAVADNHKVYLLLRDWAWMSISLGIAGAVAGIAGEGEWRWVGIHIGALTAQAALTWTMARSQSKQLRQTLLSVASTTE